VRISYESSLDFDHVLSNIRAEIGDLAIARVQRLAAERSTKSRSARTVGTLALGRAVSCFSPRSTMGHGFRSSVFVASFFRFILGNPLIAITMIGHDLSAGLFAPVELLLTESEGHPKVQRHLCASVIAIAVGENHELLEAAKALDANCNALIIKAVSA